MIFQSPLKINKQNRPHPLRSRNGNYSMWNRVEGKELFDIIKACLGKFKVYNAWEASLTTKKSGIP